MPTPETRCERCGRRNAGVHTCSPQRRYPLPWHRPMGCTCPSEFVRRSDCPVPDHQRQYEDASDDKEP